MIIPARNGSSDLRLHTVAAFVILLFLAACSEAADPCEPGFIYNGSVCCQDENNDSRCDVVNKRRDSPEQSSESDADEGGKPTPDTTEKGAAADTRTGDGAMTETKESPVAPRFVSESEKRALLDEAASSSVAAWNLRDWDGLRERLTPEEQGSMDEERFAFFLDVNAPDIRGRHDPGLEYLLHTTGYDGKAGTTMTIQGTEISDNGTAAVNVTVRHRNVQLREWAPLRFRWQEGEWRLLMDSLFTGNTTETVCGATAYPGVCFRLAAERFRNVSLCDFSLGEIVACYEALGKRVAPTTALRVCTGLESLTETDTCLLAAARSTNDSSLCRNMEREQSIFRCLGNLAGSSGAIDACFDAINESLKAAPYYEDQCVLGYVNVTKETSLCRRDWRDEEQRKECWRLG